MMATVPLISTAELAARLGDPSLLVIDARFDLGDPARGRRDHAQAHIPGAVYADLDHDLADLSRCGLGRHPLPEAAAFSDTLSRWGHRDGMAVAVYDAAAGALAAARLWWMLRAAGVVDVRVVDGGFPAWREEDRPLESGAVQRPASNVRVEFDPGSAVGFAELEHRLAAHDVVLIDARAPARFSGAIEPLDRVAGHVPGAVNRPFADNLDTTGHFKPAGELRSEFAALLGSHSPRDVVHMCGSGVTACHNLLAMERAGLSGSRLFAPSWSGWISRPSRPVATGP